MPIELKLLKWKWKCISNYLNKSLDKQKHEKRVSCKGHDNGKTLSKAKLDALVDLHVTNFKTLPFFLSWTVLIRIFVWQFESMRRTDGGVISGKSRRQRIQEIGNELTAIIQSRTMEDMNHIYWLTRKTGKHLCQSLFFNKVAGLSLQLYYKRDFS